MKKVLFISIFIFCAHAINAQRRSAVVVPDVAADVEKALAEYNFARATELLESRIAALEKKRLPTEDEDSQIEEIEKLELKLQATEKIVFIDSVVVKKEALLASLPLNGESGSVIQASEYFNTKDSLGCTVFRSQLGNQIIFSQEDNHGILKLFMSNLIGNEWSKAIPLKGLNEEDYMQNYPFMLNDGITLYYAAENDEEGMGGYDIYMTRYDNDDGTFLSPENLGMPFNSPANDYLYIIDEFNNLGWFATDRNQPEGKVCLYTFIPNTKRRIYNENEIGSQKLQSLARINSIRDTWTDPNEVKAAQARQLALRVGNNDDKKSSDFAFVLNNSQILTTISAFRTEQGKQKAQTWNESIKDLSAKKTELQNLRSKYAISDANTKQQMTAQIRLLEEKVEQLHYTIKNLEKEIRKAELGM